LKLRLVVFKDGIQVLLPRFCQETQAVDGLQRAALAAGDPRHVFPKRFRAGTHGQLARLDSRKTCVCSCAGAGHFRANFVEHHQSFKIGAAKAAGGCFNHGPVPNSQIPQRPIGHDVKILARGEVTESRLSAREELTSDWLRGNVASTAEITGAEPEEQGRREWKRWENLRRGELLVGDGQFNPRCWPALRGIDTSMGETPGLLLCIGAEYSTNPLHRGKRHRNSKRDPRLAQEGPGVFPVIAGVSGRAGHLAQSSRSCPAFRFTGADKVVLAILNLNRRHSG
jgi:hypothetical protein